MKIIIIGAGRIGVSLSKDLADENNEVYLIEKDEVVAGKATEKLDVKVIIGNGADPDVLQKAPVSEAELVLAVTTSDETNLVVCSLASMFGAKRRIARVRSTSLSTTLAEFGYHQFNINEIINPELAAAQEIIKTIEAPGAREVSEFANGKILLRIFDIPEDSMLCGQKLEDLRDEDFPWPFLIVSIIRAGVVLVPKGNTRIQPEDRIYVLLPVQSLGEFLTFVNPNVKLPKKVVIYGATITGKHVALGLSAKVRDIILLEEDVCKAKEIAGELESVRIINGSAAETDILTECGVEVADVFIAASDNDHSNLISAVLAKKMGAKNTIIMSQQPDYMAIVNALDIDVIINPHTIAVEQILHLARGKGVSAVTKLMESDSEAIEFIPEAGAAVTKDIIKNIKFPKNVLVGAVCSQERVILADGDTQIKEGEKVIVFCQETAVKKLQEFFIKK
ncbi:Trk potassium uptake system protein TrkA [hydrothermal vent metagenome]|uniref:Trk potassium uptake system protein TrkA n=1 Tax=hydrothermal vent metagenome TaxID=652676 RepID=A0A3B1DF58_9ZZZZ